jgi:hypothetical protein
LSFYCYSSTRFARASAFTFSRREITEIEEFSTTKARGRPLARSIKRAEGFSIKPYFFFLCAPYAPSWLFSLQNTSGLRPIFVG